MAAGALHPRPSKRARSNSHHGHSINIGSVMLMVGAFVVVGAALMARSGFRGRDHVIGVDLGTTYSVVAISQHNNVAVIPDQFGQLLTPSIVAYLANGEHYVGRRARAYRTIDPKHTFFNAKRFIGRSFTDVLADNETDYDFQIDSTSAGVNGELGPCFRVNLTGHPSCVTPVNVGTVIVRHLRDMACRFVGHDQITKAVIAVPVDFNKKQRAATVAAFEAAGLSVSRVLDEPTAAAIAYGLHQDPSIQFIIVFDFGGGTLDVSLLYVRSGSINVVDTMGDNHLGGEDIDAVVARHLTKLVEQQLGEKLPSTVDTESNDAMHQDSFIEAEGETTKDDSELPCTRAGLRRVAEQLKRALSSQETASAACFVVQPEDGERKTIAVDLTRREFETLCTNLFKRTMLPVQAVLDANSMSTTDVDAVVLVGGSTRLPWIRQALRDKFHGRAPLSDIDPDIAVAYGAARTID